MGKSYDVSGIDPEKVMSGFTPIPEGWYHVQIVDVLYKDDEKNRGTAHQFSWQIVGAPNKPEMLEAVGKKINEFMYDWTEQFPKLFVRIGMAIGAITKEYLASLRAKGETMPEPHFSDWNGLSCIAKITQEPSFKDPKKLYSKIGWEFYTLDSDEAKAAGVMLNQEIIAAGAVPLKKEEDEQF